MLKKRLKMNFSKKTNNRDAKGGRDPTITRNISKVENGTF